MAYKEYDYGSYRTEIKKLLRERIDLKQKLWYYNNKIGEVEDRISEIEDKIDYYESLD